MPLASKSTTSAAPKDRRKSDKLDSKTTRPGLVKLTLSPDKLRAIFYPTSTAQFKESTPIKEDSPHSSTPVPPAPASNPDDRSETTPNTPNANGTPAPTSVMGPPADAPKKKGKRANGNGVDGPPKVRGKPGPKKKARLDDGTLEPGRPSGLSHKLGPKANQGAINAGLRALDRSGKPCRKWSKGGFQLKSFTGVTWTIPRWTAPPRPRPEDVTADPSPQPESASASAGGSGSNKENGTDHTTNKEAPAMHENQQAQSDNGNSTSGGDVEMTNAPSLENNSPAPVPTAA